MQSRTLPPSTLTDRLLVVAFGLYQSIHIIVNGRYMFTAGLTVFPGPPGGWNRQTVEWARGMAIPDWVVAVASVVFVIAWWQRRTWSTALGIVTTTAYIFAAVVFTIGIGTTGAWGEAPAFYTFIVGTAFPGFWLWVRLLRAGGRRLF